MNVALIIPIYKQYENIDKIIKGIESQTRKPDCIYIVLDRPTIEEQELVSNKLSSSSIISKFLINQENPTSKDDAFLAGFVRNIGIREAIRDNCELFIFIDGDCVPQNKLVEGHLKKCDYELPVLSVGRRRESIYRWVDRREHIAELSHLGLFQGNGVIVSNPELLKQYLIVWSCNIAMNRLAIDLIKKLNIKLFGRNEVFSSDFNGSWGGEDSYLGIQAYHCRIFITTVGEKTSGILHIDHPRPSDKYDPNHKKFLETQIEILRKKLKLSPLELSFFSV